MLVIENGAQSINPDGKIIYSVKLIDDKLNEVVPTDIKWSSSKPSVCQISSWFYNCC